MPALVALILLQTVLSWDPDPNRSNDYELISVMEVVPTLTILDTL